MESFLGERGLVLSPTKTRITPIEEGFDFLGVNIRKYNGSYFVNQSKANLSAFLQNIRHTIKSNATAKTENLIRILNPKIRGWANYHCHNSAKQTFSKASATSLTLCGDGLNVATQKKGWNGFDRNISEAKDIDTGYSSRLLTVLKERKRTLI